MKKQYEAPQLIDLSAPARTLGGACSAGENPTGQDNNCTRGQTADPLCKRGNIAQVSCAKGVEV